MAAASEADNRDDALALARLMRTLDELPKPTIARVHGAAFGGGVGLVACCDIAIAAPDAQVRPDRKQARPAAGGDLALRDRRHRRAPGAALVRHRRALRRATRAADRPGAPGRRRPSELDAAVQRQVDLLLQGRPDGRRRRPRRWSRRVAGAARPRPPRCRQRRADRRACAFRRKARKAWAPSSTSASRAGRSEPALGRRKTCPERSAFRSTKCSTRS